jgi:hypothetical protein
VGDLFYGWLNPTLPQILQNPPLENPRTCQDRGKTTRNRVKTGENRVIRPNWTNLPKSMAVMAVMAGLGGLTPAQPPPISPPLRLGPACPHCGNRELDGIWLTRNQARIYDALRAGTVFDLSARLGINVNSLKAQVHYLNMRLDLLGLRVVYRNPSDRYRDEGYRLIRIGDAV